MGYFSLPCFLRTGQNYTFYLFGGPSSVRSPQHGSTFGPRPLVRHEVKLVLGRLRHAFLQQGGPEKTIRKTMKFETPKIGDVECVFAINIRWIIAIS